MKQIAIPQLTFDSVLNSASIRKFVGFSRWILIFLILLLLNTKAFCEWGQTPEDFVTVDEPSISEPHIFADGQGGVWVLCNSGMSDTKVFHVNHLGNVSRDSVGVRPFSRSHRDHSAVVSADGNLFVMAAVITGDSYKVMVQKINRAGEKLWGNGGMAIDTLECSIFLGSLAANDVNGLYILAAQEPDSVLYSHRLPFVQKISSDGELLWGPCGIQIGWEAIVYYRGSYSNFFEIVPMVSDGAGGIVLTGKVTNRRPEERYQFQRISQNGEFPWGEAVIPDSAELASNSWSIIADNAGKTVYTYQKRYRIPEVLDTLELRLSRLNQEGQLEWSTEIVSDTQDKRPFSFITQVGEFYAILWSYFWDKIAITYIDQNGEFVLDEPVYPEPPLDNQEDIPENERTSFREFIAVPFDNTIICIWQRSEPNAPEPRLYYHRVFAQRFDLQGRELWNDGEDVMVFMDDRIISVAPCPGNGLIVATNGGNSFGLHLINANGELGQLITGIPPHNEPDSHKERGFLRPNLYPNPSNNRVQILFPSLVGLDRNISLIDLTGRRIQSLDIPVSKTITFPLDNIPTGNYFVRYEIYSEYKYLPLHIMK